MSSEKWTRDRCKRELENPANWETDFVERYITESSFEFYSIHFVKLSVKTAHADIGLSIWGAYIPAKMHGYENIERDFFVVMHEGDTTALTKIGKYEAVEMMMDALKKEGILLWH